MKKYRRVISTSSRVSWLQVWKRIHLWLSLLISTCWWWKEAQREVEKRRYSRNSLYSERKRVQGCVSKDSDPMDFEILQKSWIIGIERFGGTHQKILRMHLVQNWILERRAIWRHYPKRWTSWAKSLSACFLRNNNLRKLRDKQIVSAKWRGIWREKKKAQGRR